MCVQLVGAQLFTSQFGRKGGGQTIKVFHNCSPSSILAHCVQARVLPSIECIECVYKTIGPQRVRVFSSRIKRVVVYKVIYRLVHSRSEL